MHSPTYLLSHSMEQNPSWEATRFSYSQEILRILWNRKAHYRIYNSTPPVPLLSQINPIHPPIQPPEIPLTIILPPTSGSSNWFLSLRFPHQNPAYTSPLTYVLHALPTSFLLVLITRIIFVIYMLCSSLHSPVTSSLIGPNIVLSTLFSNSLSLRSTLNTSDQVSHPYKTHKATL